ncbi:MAG: PaaI family thioesterase [Bacteroidales bacterium]
MIRLKNPYAQMEGYNCFGCSPVNPFGLKMEFFEEGDELICNWNPGNEFAGFHDILHGGIQATMIDEIASWVVLVKLDTSGLTLRLNARYRESVRISKGGISLRARLVEVRRSIATIHVQLLDGEGKLCSEGTVDYFIFPRERAVTDFHYPGKEAFYYEDMR